MQINGIGLIKGDNELSLSGMRRSGRFAKLAVAAAQAAVQDSGMVLNGHDTGIILATSFGPHVTTFEFLDNILTFSEKEVSPTIFSHSVHNAAAFYAANALKVTGPTISVTDFCEPLKQALSLAKAWLDCSVCGAVLLGKVEEPGKVMSDIALSHKRKELEFNGGALFMILSQKSGVKIYRNINDLLRHTIDGQPLELVANLMGL
jgi:3-oxoacyl-(acyl-carrier-protein) synthase